jgi:exosome complex exonuclease DIS3/RRP44
VLRNKRTQDGALNLASPEVKFDMDADKNPKDVKIYETIDTNWLVEEFMLLANIYVARKIVTHFPAYSVLRRHNSPKPTEIEEF